MKCYRKGGCGPYEMYSCADCPASRPGYVARGKKVLTNADHIRSMTDEGLAAHNVQDSLEYTVDYDWDDNLVGEYTPCFKTSDGAIFWSYEDAVEYELHWLKQPYKEDT